MEERITSRKNPLIQLTRRLLTSAAYRRETGLFVGDGTKLLSEAIRYWPGLDTVFLADDVPCEPLPEGVRLVRLPQDLMAYLSPMDSPQGAVFLCRNAAPVPITAQPGMLLLDRIQDPGNLGTILRTADALDVPVVLLEECADPYSWKTVRASMGAVFRRPVFQGKWADIQAQCRRLGIEIGVTALSERASDIRQVPLKDMALVIGSEGQGIREEILRQADRELIIPMNPHCESLNAAIASAIVMWQMKR